MNRASACFDIEAPFTNITATACLTIDHSNFQASSQHKAAVLQAEHTMPKSFSQGYCLITCTVYPRIRRIVLSLAFPHISTSLRPVYALYHITWLLRALLVSVCAFFLFLVFFIVSIFSIKKSAGTSAAPLVGQDCLPSNLATRSKVRSDRHSGRC